MNAMQSSGTGPVVRSPTAGWSSASRRRSGAWVPGLIGGYAGGDQGGPSCQPLTIASSMPGHFLPVCDPMVSYSVCLQGQHELNSALFFLVSMCVRGHSKFLMVASSIVSTHLALALGRHHPVPHLTQQQLTRLQTSSAPLATTASSSI